MDCGQLALKQKHHPERLGEKSCSPHGSQKVDQGEVPQRKKAETSQGHTFMIHPDMSCTNHLGITQTNQIYNYAFDCILRNRMYVE